MSYRLVYSGATAAFDGGHAPATLTVTPPANLHVQATYVVEFINACADAAGITIDVYNNDGTYDCLLTSFSVAVSSNVSKIVQGLFVPRVSKFTIHPVTAGNTTGTVTVSVYELEANI